MIEPIPPKPSNAAGLRPEDGDQDDIDQTPEELDDDLA